MMKHILPKILHDAGEQDSRSITYIDGEKDERTVGYGDLLSRALGILHHFQQAGMRPGDELVIFTSSNEPFVDAFWAAVLGGIVPVPVAVGISDDHRVKLLKICKTLNQPWLFTEHSLVRRLEDFAAANDLVETVSEILERVVAVDDIQDISIPGQEHSAQPDDTAFIQFSSGSTSDPKGVVLTHQNVMTNMADINAVAGNNEDQVSLSWMPLTHDMGLIGFHLCMLAANASHYIMDTSLFVRRPLLWLQKASEKRVTALCSPNFGYKHTLKLMASRGLSDIDLSSVRLVFNGAEPISIDLANTFLEKMAPFGLASDVMFPVYGLAEASLGVTIPEPRAALLSVIVHRHGLKVGEPVREALESDEDAVKFVLLGAPLPHCEVKLVDDEGSTVAERIVGHILIRGDNVTRGYYGREPERPEKDDWLSTGDLGFFTEGELVVTGRSKDIIFVNGQNYYPHDLENMAHEVEGLELGKVAAAGVTNPDSGTDDILVFVLHRGSMEEFDPLARKVRWQINERSGLEVRHVVPVRRIPKTTSGKVQRSRLAMAFLDGDFAEDLAGLDTIQAQQAQDSTGEGSDLEQTLKSICAAIVVDRAIGIDDNLFEIGISSLALAQIHERVEELYPGQLDIADVFDYPSIRELAVFMESKRDSN